VRAAFFDLDKTVIAKPSMVALGPELHARGFLQRRTLVRAGISQLIFQHFGADDTKLQKIRDAVLKITKGWDREEVLQLVGETINDVVEPLIYREALDLIDFHLSRGDEVWIVSMAPQEIVQPFVDMLGITGAISSIAKVDEYGKFTGEMEFLAHGEYKAVAMRALAEERGYDLAECCAYSDSETDIPMLRAVGHPYAVNPDRQLTKKAREGMWPILRFTHPVRAHDRAKSHTPFVLSALVLGFTALLGRNKMKAR